MTAVDVPAIIGQGVVGPGRDLGMPLDEMIFEASSLALADAGIPLSQVDAVWCAASDLMDGLAISTMTLTSATGSLGREEARVCDDSLAALAMAANGIRAGRLRTVLVCAWSKLSAGHHRTVRPLGTEPAFTRPLGLSDEAMLGLLQSARYGHATVAPQPIPGADTAVALVVRASPTKKPVRRAILGCGWAAGTYLMPEDGRWTALTKAVGQAFDEAERPRIGKLLCAGFDQVADNVLQDVLQLEIPVHKSGRAEDLGYAAGLVAVAESRRFEDTTLIVSRSGIGLGRAYAAVLGSTR